MKKIIFGILFLAAFAVQTKAQSVTAEAKAEVSSQLSISGNPVTGATLNFGKIAVSAGSPGSCTISTVGVLTVAGSVNTIPSTTSNAIFDLTGIAGATYAITLPASTLVTRVGGAETMTVDNFNSRPNSTGSNALTGTLNNLVGTDSFSVGGKLNVNTNQANGIYIGTFLVSVAYN